MSIGENILWVLGRIQFVYRGNYIILTKQYYYFNRDTEYIITEFSYNIYNDHNLIIQAKIQPIKICKSN